MGCPLCSNVCVPWSRSPKGVCVSLIGTSSRWSRSARWEETNLGGGKCARHCHGWRDESLHKRSQSHKSKDRRRWVQMTLPGPVWHLPSRGHSGSRMTHPPTRDLREKRFLSPHTTTAVQSRSSLAHSLCKALFFALSCHSR